MEPSSPPVFLVQKADGVSYSSYICGSCVAILAVQLLLVLLLSQVLGIQFSDALGLVAFESFSIFGYYEYIFKVFAMKLGRMGGYNVLVFLQLC